MASGVVVNTHYCMGRIAAVDYGYTAISNCGTCGMEEQMGCCHTEQKIVKLQDDHQLAKAGIDLMQAPVLTHVWDELNLQVSTLSIQHYFVSCPHDPPDQRNNAFYIYNNVFRI